MKKTTSQLPIYTIGTLVVFFVSAPLVASADWTTGLTLARLFSGLPNGLYVEEVVFNVMQWLLRLFTFLAVISFVVTGLMFFLSGSSSDMATKAKRGVGYSIIGVAVGLIGYIVIAQIDSLLR